MVVESVSAVESTAPSVKITPFSLHDAAAAGDAELLKQLLASLDEANDEEFVPADDRHALATRYCHDFSLPWRSSVPLTLVCSPAHQSDFVACNLMNLCLSVMTRVMVSEA
jgi:hypothetical protein